MPHRTYDQLLQGFSDNPWYALEASKIQHHSTRRRDWEFATIGYAFARWIREQPRELEQLYLTPFFEQGYRPNPRHLLLHVLQFQRDDRHGEDGDRAQAQARALQGAFDADWSAEQVLDALVEHRGFAPFERWFYQDEEAAEDGEDLSEVDADRRQLGLAPATMVRGGRISERDGAADEADPDTGGAPCKGDQTREVPARVKRTAGAARSRTAKYADGIDGRHPLEVLPNGELFDSTMELEEEEFIDIRLRRIGNGSLQYRRFEITRLP